MNIIAIDPGLSAGTNKKPHGTGIAVFEHGVLIATYFIRGLSPEHDDKKRTEHIIETIRASIPDWPRYHFVIERSSYQMNVNIAYSHYGLCWTLNYIFGPVSYIAPTSVKKLVTGSGKADKKDIYQTLQQLYVHNELFTRIHWEHDDVVDAVAIGLAYLKSKQGV